MAGSVVSRRGLFTSAGRRDKTEARVRPPQAIAEDAFLALCVDCTACAEACPEGIIQPDDEGRPILDFKNDGCTFCEACTEACPTGALDAAAARPWAWRADVGADCLSYNGITCRACSDSCEAGAIRFRLMTGGRDVPLLDPSDCTGCGTCLSVCPVSAISHTSADSVHANRGNAS